MIATITIIALAAMCLALDKRRHRYYRAWRDERSNAAWWRAKRGEGGE
jgi:hypothetical protein